MLLESSCVRLDLEMDTRRKVPKKGLDTFRSMGVELEAELETDPEKCIVAFLKHLLLQREKLREGVLQTHLGTHRETVDWWEKFLESLEQKKRKLIDVEEGSVNLTLFCPTKESFEQLEDETWTAGVTTKFRKLLSLLGNASWLKRVISKNIVHFCGKNTSLFKILFKMFRKGLCFHFRTSYIAIVFFRFE